MEIFRAFLVASTLMAATLPAAAQSKTAEPLKRVQYTDKQVTRDIPEPHPLEWWTKNPLRLDASSDLMLGFKAPDGHTITAADFKVEQTINHLGPIAGRDIVEIVTRITQGEGQDSSSWWKDLLVSTGKNRYIDIFSLQADAMPVGDCLKEWSSGVAGSGADSVLWTNNPDGGNGGGCWEGYWWIDAAGPHELDFNPLKQALDAVVPKNATYPLGCWALDMESATLRGPVQRKDADCHACGYVGTVEAKFHVHDGKVEATSVKYQKDEE